MLIAVNNLIFLENFQKFRKFIMSQYGKCMNMGTSGPYLFSLVVLEMIFDIFVYGTKGIF